MTVTLLTTTDAAPALATLHDTPADHNPARVYLASLGSPAAKRTMHQALAVSAEILTQGALDLEDLPWGTLRFQHTAALQAALRQRYTAAGANKTVGADITYKPLRAKMDTTDCHAVLWRGINTCNDSHASQRFNDVPIVPNSSLVRRVTAP